MPTILICPRCQKFVSIPTGIDAAARVRCPLCEMEYELGEAIPPELILVDAALPRDEGAGGQEIVVEPSEDALDDEEGAVISIAQAAAGVEDVETVDVSSEGEYRLEGDEDAGEIGAMDEEEESVEDEEDEAAAVVGRPSFAAVRGRQRPQKSAFQSLVGWLVTIIGMAISGLLACVVAYYALAWFHGPNFKNLGWPMLPLPGIERLTASSKQQEKPADKPSEIESQAGGKQKKQEKAPVVPSETPQPEPQPAAPEKAEASPPQEVPLEAKSDLTEPAEPELPSLEPQPAELPPPEISPIEPAAPAPVVELLRPRPGTAEYLGPRMPPTVTSDDLGKALKEANGFVLEDRLGEIETPEVYDAFARLGKAATFVNGNAGDTQLADRIAAVGTLAEKIALRPDLLDAIGRMANQRIESDKEQSEGVLLAGTLRTVAKQNRLWGAIVELAGESNTVSVLADHDAEVQTGDRVVVLGVVVREPSAHLVGYSGSKPVVVWGSIVTKVP